MNKWFACALVALTTGCPSIETDPDETTANPIVEFDPAKSIVPFPNNLLINPMTGKVNLPAGCNESAAQKALREGVLNQLDGFGTFETAMSVTLTKPIDPASVTDNVLLYKVTQDPSTSNPIPVVVIPGSSVRFAQQTRNDDGTLTCSEPNPIDSMTIVPRVPLDQKSTYIVALKQGLKTAEGQDYTASFTWSLVRQAENPVTLDDNGNVIADRTPLDPSTEAGLASLKGIDLLWKAHASVLTFLGAKQHDRNTILLAWSFRTQTTTDALDASVTGTPAANINTTALLTGPAGSSTPISLPTLAIAASPRTQYPFLVCTTGAPAVITPPLPAVPPESNDVQCFLKMALGGGTSCTAQADCEARYRAGTGACQLLGCANIGDLLAARMSAPNYQIETPNPLDSTKPVPGPWSDPVKPTKVKDEGIHTLITIPTGTPPAAGWPVAIFQHGLGRGRTDILAIGGHLAGPTSIGSPFATVAIDAVAHGDGIASFPGRAIRVSNDPARGCADPATFSTKPQCYAGFLSANLGATRDNIRQTNVDHLQLVASIKACGTTACGAFRANASSIVYIGQSLGGITGSTTVAASTDIKAGVLNVPGVGWADIFENTQTLAIRCTLVDALIDAGTLMGEKSNLAAMPPTGLCTTDAWKMQPGYRQFAAIGRWVLDPADPANFTSRLATKKFLIQEVVGDTVVPNIATMNEAALTGRTAAMARTATVLSSPPSDAITMMPTTSKYVRHMNVPANAGAGFPGNTYHHGSLLSPAPSANGNMPCNPAMPTHCDGVLGTVQMVTDAVTFLHLNK